MIIYIIHSDQIYTYKLPKRVEGKYILFDYDINGNRRNLSNIEGINGKWYIYDNENVKINYNQKQVKSIELAYYNFYQLTIFSTDSVFIYALPAYDETFMRKRIINGSSFVIGNKEDCDIVYNYQGISKKQVKIEYKDGVYEFENLAKNVPIYINHFRKDSSNLNYFDTIFIMGLKIVVCNGFILINNPLNMIYSVSNKFASPEDSLIIQDYKVNSKSFNDFYEEKDYFYISPIFQNKLKPIKLDIASPPGKDQSDKTPMLLVIMPSLIMSLTSIISCVNTIKSYNSGQATKSDLMSNLIMVGSMLLMSLLWPFVERLYSKFSTFRNNTMKKLAYTKYLKGKEKLIQSAIDEQKMVLKSNYYSLEECQLMIQNRTPDLFSRSYENDDFLRIRLGVGNVLLYGEINFSQSDFTLEENSLEKKAVDMIERNKYIPEVPYIVSIKEYGNLTFILDSIIFNNYLRSIVLQIVSLHSSLDLKIVVFTSKNSTSLSYLKESNHCWNNDKDFRYFADTLEDAQTISNILLKEYNARMNKQDNLSDMPYFLIISDSINIYRNLDILKAIIKDGRTVKMGLVLFDTKTTNIPKGCNNFVDISEKEGTFFQTRMDTSAIQHFKPEFIDYSKVDINKCFSLLNNIPLKYNISGSNMLPDNFGFLEMFNVGNIEQLNSDLRWESSNLINSLSTPVGIDANGNLLYLDLHEKSHGPHGLIAGMTGSGKSEFIVTYILSLAVNYRPDEVQFVLIDYKGGGLAGAFENRKTGLKLPHLVGTITNLDVSEMHRTLVSIKSELQRRQRMFNSAKEKLDTGNIDIYKYQRLYREGSLTEPLSHLFIICDEFAELKAQQPDFMDELVSAARIGRSLGIHLILATQKPSGVVDDQIWSNSKFKVCCKVQTTEDSKEMIRRDDAAYLKEAGRFFLQVGYDEYFVEGQSAYSGGIYTPTNAVQTKVENSISFINNIGQIYKNIEIKDENKEERVDTENLGEELINVLKYLIDIAKIKGYPYQQLWLDNVPKEIYYQNIVNKYNVKPLPYKIDPVIGEFDDPVNQRQGYVSLDLNTRGNTWICGATGSGKTTLLSTIIYGTVITHNSDEVNIYIIDCGAEKLNIFNKAPQVGEVLFSTDGNKINYLFYKIEAEIEKRKKYFASTGTSFERCVANGKTPFPTILVVINDNDIFKEQFSDLYEERFPAIARDCNKFGIIFIITSANTNSLGYNIENYFPQKIVLRLIDSTDYVLFFDTKLVPATNPGRGLIQLDSIYEFQTNLLFREDEYEKNINYVFSQLNKCLSSKAPSVPVVPEKVTTSYVTNESYTIINVPIGVNINTAQIARYNFNKTVNLIYSTDYKLMANFLISLTKILTLIKDVKMIVLNAQNDISLNLSNNIKYYDSSFKQVIPILTKNIEKYNSSSSNDKFIIFILGYSKLQEHMQKINQEDSNIDTIDDLIFRTKNNNFKFVILENNEHYSYISKSKFYENCEHDLGIWIGKGFESQRVFETDIYTDKKYTKDHAVIVRGEQAEYIKYMQ